jgi:lysophospholipase L1-like esterase
MNVTELIDRAREAAMSPQVKLASGEQQRMRQEQEAKIKNFRVLNAVAQKGAILFTGSSLMEQFPVCELARSAGMDRLIYNRGIGGTTTDDFLREIDTVLLDLEPSKVFLNIGTNDMTDRVYGRQWMDHLEKNYEKILQTARERIPQAEIFCMAYYPTNRHLPDQNEWVRNMLKERTVENIAECNRRVAALAEKYGCRYIDANEGLADENGEQKREFAIDGVHMLASAYRIVFENLKKYL